MIISEKRHRAADVIFLLRTWHQDQASFQRKVYATSTQVQWHLSCHMTFSSVKKVQHEVKL